MPSIEDRIEEMWEDPQDRRERWLGFFGKLAYEVGGVAIVFVPVIGALYGLAFVFDALTLPTTLASLTFILPLFLWVANKAFCNIIGR